MSMRRISAYMIMKEHRIPVYQMVIVEQTTDCIKDFIGYSKKHESYMTLYREITIQGRRYKFYINRWDSVGTITLHETNIAPSETYYVLPFDELYDSAFEIIYPEMFCNLFTIYDIPKLKRVGVSSNYEVLKFSIDNTVQEEISKYLTKVKESEEEN